MQMKVKDLIKELDKYNQDYKLSFGFETNNLKLKQFNCENKLVEIELLKDN